MGSAMGSASGTRLTLLAVATTSITSASTTTSSITGTSAASSSTNSSNSTSTTFTTTSATTTTTTFPTAVLEVAPARVGLCSDVVFNGLASTGGQGLGLTYTWEFGPGTPGSARSTLDAARQAANAANSGMLTFTADDIGAALLAARAAEGHRWPGPGAPGIFAGDGMLLEMELGVENSFGARSLLKASAVVEVQDEEPPPLISAAGDTVLLVRPSEAVRLTVKTREENRICFPGLRAIDVRWEYMNPSSATWTALDYAPFNGSSTLVDVSRPPNLCSFPSMVFSPRTRHMVRATASYRGVVLEHWHPASVVFRLMVSTREPPLATITGPRVVASLCNFTLDASGSTDVGLGHGEELTFEWSCQPAPASDPSVSCYQLQNFQALKTNLTDGSGASGQMMLVESAQLPAGSYVFNVVVRPFGIVGRAAEGSASFTVNVEEGTWPAVACTPPWESTGSVSTNLGLGKVVATVQASADGACRRFADATYTFALVEHRVPPEASMLTLLPTDMRDAVLGSEFDVETPPLQRTLVVGKTYSYALLYAPRWVEQKALDELRTNTSNWIILSELPVVGVRISVRTSPFTIDDAPRNGTISMYPSMGPQVTSPFTLYTDGWIDEDPNSLQYAFYLFPSSAAMQNGTLVVEWDDVTSQHYWVRLGGLMLRAWHPSLHVSDITLRGDAQTLVVRARDSYNARGTVASAIPAMGGPPAGLIPLSDLTAVLNKAIVSNDAIRLLNTASLVAEASAAMGGNDRSVMDARVLSAFAVASDIAEASAHSLQLAAQAVAAYVVARPSGDQTTMLQLIDVIERCLGALLQRMDATWQTSWVASAEDAADVQAYQDVWKGASLAVLKSIMAICSSYDVTSQPSTFKIVNNLVSKLGYAVLHALRPGDDWKVETVLNFAPKRILGRFSRRSVVGLPVNATIDVPGLSVPADIGSWWRRFRSDCDTLELRQTEWFGDNPFRWMNATNATGGYSYLVSATSTVKFVSVSSCGDTVQSAGDTLRIHLPLPVGVWPSPQCLFYDETNKTWSAEGLSVLLQWEYEAMNKSNDTNASNDTVYSANLTDNTSNMSNASGMTDGYMVCVSSRGFGAYTVLPHGFPVSVVVPALVQTVMSEEEKTGTELWLIILLVIIGCCCCCCCFVGLCHLRRGRKKLTRVSAAKEDDMLALDDYGNKSIALGDADLAMAIPSAMMSPPRLNLSDLRAIANGDMLGRDHEEMQDALNQELDIRPPGPELVAAVESMMRARKKDRKAQTQDPDLTR